MSVLYPPLEPHRDGTLDVGRFDISSPPDVPWLLAEAWPVATLHLVRTGHVGGAPMIEPIVRATDRFARAWDT